VFKRPDEELFVIVYVDDGIVVGETVQACRAVVEQLRKQFKMRIMSGEMFIGIELREQSGSLEISQRGYIDSTLKRFNMDNAKPSNTLFVDVVQGLKSTIDRPTDAPYRQAIGSLTYLVACTRPDIVYCVNQLARHNNNLQESHWTRVKQVFRYPKATRNLCIKFSKDKKTIDGYSDADWREIAKDTQLQASSSCMEAGP